MTNNSSKPSPLRGGNGTDPLIPFQLRDAQPCDAEAIAALSTQLGYPSAAHESLQRISAVLAQPGNAIIVAEMADQVVAWVHVFGAYRVESSPFAEIGGLVVDSTHRGTGIGRALVEAACQWAISAGFADMRVRSNVLREETHAFYLRYGFSTTKSQAVFSMSLAAKAL